MPDGLDDLLIEAAGGTPEPKEPDPVPPADPEPEPVPPEKKPNPMKEVRDRLNSEQKAKERIEKAKREIHTAYKYDYIVVNDTVENAAEYKVYRKTYNASTKKWDSKWKKIQTVKGPEFIVGLNTSP